MKKKTIKFRRKPLWKIQYECIKKHRENLNATIDTKGCDKFYDELLPDNINRLYILLGAFLSSQTNDNITYACVMRFKKLNISLEDINDMRLEDLVKIIKPVGFYNQKSKNLKKICKIVIDNFGGLIPSDIKTLLKFPGIGYKMAILISNLITKSPQGICVDTHMHRICNRLGWVETKNAEKTRLELEEWIPKSYWLELNPIIVGYGQTICKSKNPKCDQCSLKNSCKFYNNI